MLLPPQLSGTTFYCQDMLPLIDLSRDLCRVCAFLQNDQPYVELRRISDWQQHDELLFDRGTLTFHELFQIVAPPRHLFEAMELDDDVFIAISPVDRR